MINIRKDMKTPADLDNENRGLNEILESLEKNRAEKKGRDKPLNVQVKHPVEQPNIETPKKREYKSDGCEVWSDLEQSCNVDPKGLGRAIKNLSSHYRKPPDTSKPLDVFIPSICDVPVKDEFSLMDIAVFGLSKKPGFKSLRYDLKDAHIVVSGSFEYGMATIFDYDIFLFVVSHLNAEMERIRKLVKYENIDAYLPSRTIKTTAYDVLTFCKRNIGGKQYKALEESLKRLKTTSISIEEKENGDTYRRVGMFGLIDDFKFLKNKETGELTGLTISIANWAYDGIVRNDGIVRTTTPTVLTTKKEYFLLKKPYHKFLYRLALKSAGKGSAEYFLTTIYERSGSDREFRFFKRDIKKAIAELGESGRLIDYEISLHGEGKMEKIRFYYIKEPERLTAK